MKLSTAIERGRKGLKQTKGVFARNRRVNDHYELSHVCALGAAANELGLLEVLPDGRRRGGKTEDMVTRIASATATPKGVVANVVTDNDTWDKTFLQIIGDLKAKGF